MSELTPEMTAGELDLLRSTARGRRRVVEFGTGGSTAEWIALGIEHVVSVESDPAWIERVREDLAPAISSGRLTLLHADIGPTTKFGRPDGREHLDRWPRYWSQVWTTAAVRDHAVDLVFVDGRFRVACALNAVLHVGPECVILIHDFWRRPKYHVVLEHLRIVATVDDLVVCQRAADLDAARVVDDLARHVVDFG